MAVKKKKIKVKRKIVTSESANAPFKSLIRVLKATKMIDCWSIPIFGYYKISSNTYDKRNF